MAQRSGKLEEGITAQLLITRIKTIFTPVSRDNPEKAT